MAKVDRFLDQSLGSVTLLILAALSFPGCSASTDSFSRSGAIDLSANQSQSVTTSDPSSAVPPAETAPSGVVAGTGAPMDKPMDDDGDDDTVKICHIPAGDPAAQKTLCLKRS